MATTSENGRRFLLLYGSQTGQAKSIAEIIADKAAKNGLSPDIHCFSESEKGFELEKEHVVVMVVSTTGEGEPPDTVAKFWRKLRRSSGTPLEQCLYALLGLGDSNYANFCNMGKVLNRKLLELGAKPFYPTGYADDGVGPCIQQLDPHVCRLDLVVEPWIDGLWTPLGNVLQHQMGEGASHEQQLGTKDSLETTPTKEQRGVVTTEITNSGNGTASSSPVHHGQSHPDVATATTVPSSLHTETPLHADPSFIPAAQELSLSPVQSLTRDLQITLGLSTQPQTTLGELPLPQTTTGDLPRPQTTPGDPPRPQTTPGDPPQPQTTPDDLPRPQTTPGDPPRPQTTPGDPPQPQTTPDDPPRPQTTPGDPPRPQTALSELRDDWSTCRDLETRLRQAHSEVLQMTQLSLPSQQQPWIAMEIETPPTCSSSDFPYHLVTYGVKLRVSMATIVGARTLTSADAVKRTLEMEVRLEPESGLTYEPGDAFGFVCPNSKEEVDYIIGRLGLLPVQDHTIKLAVRPEMKKKVLPQHIPPDCTVRQFFFHCADIRAIPKKAFLLMLSLYCGDPHDKRRMEELSSKEGTEEYNEVVAEAHTDLVDLLHAFPSCLPPLERMIELLPRLQPRYYSAVSSPLLDPHTVKIAFNVTVLPRRVWSTTEGRFGLCTGWFDQVMKGLGTSTVKVPLLPRLLNTFRPPPDPLTPVVMIGPGTGVAPFVGFLRHWKAQGKGLGPRWLFYGCRHPEKDYIYRWELEGYHGDGTLHHLSVTFSRLEPRSDVSYVHQEMRRKWEELGEWLVERKAVVYVCGDANNMTKDIKAAMMDVLTKYCTSKGISRTPEDLFADLLDSGRYHVDAWS